MFYRLRIFSLVIFSLSFLALTSCSAVQGLTDSESTFASQGGIAGATAGITLAYMGEYGLVGSTLAIASGYFLGNTIGKHILYARDDYVMRRAAYYGLAHGQAGQKIFWYNWATGHAGEFILHDTFHDEDGKLCKINIIHVGMIDKPEAQTQCLMPSGDWMITDTVALPYVMKQTIQVLKPNKESIHHQLIYNPNFVGHAPISM